MPAQPWSLWSVALLRSPQTLTDKQLYEKDSMRTHILGVLREKPEWQTFLAPFEMESSLSVGDWDNVQRLMVLPDLQGPQIALGRVLLAVRTGDPMQFQGALRSARKQFGASIVAAGRESYHRCYEAVIQLHILHEIELICRHLLDSPKETTSSVLAESLSARSETTSPNFRWREPILNMRRTAYRMRMASGNTGTACDLDDDPLGRLWLSTAKIARKAGHMQTAFSAILQAENLATPFAFVERAKLSKKEDQLQRGIQAIDVALTDLPTSIKDRLNVTSQTQLGPNVLFDKDNLPRAKVRRHAIWMLRVVISKADTSPWL